MPLRNYSLPLPVLVCKVYGVPLSPCFLTVGKVHRSDQMKRHGSWKSQIQQLLVKDIQYVTYSWQQSPQSLRVFHRRFRDLLCASFSKYSLMNGRYPLPNCCEKFHQVDMKTVLITLIQPKITYCLSTFRLHVGSLHHD